MDSSGFFIAKKVVVRIKQIIITQNDFGVYISTQFMDNGEKLNILGRTVKADIVFPDKTVHTYTATITDAPNGIAEITVIEEMTAQPGLYMVYFNITDASSHITAQNVVTYFVTAENGGVSV